MKNKGITLVALVITIIILLILAGIAISQLTNSGLFGNAQLAKERFNTAENEETELLKNYENQISEYSVSSQSRNSTTTKTFSKTVLLNTPTSSTGDITLSDSIENYDAVCVIAQVVYNNNYEQASTMYIMKEDYYTTCNSNSWRFLINFSFSDTERRFAFGFDSNNTNKICVGTAKNTRLYKVYGINF